MWLPMAYQNDEGTRTCAKCGKKFTIPEDDVKEYVDVCEECGAKLELEYAAQELKSAASAEAANTAAKALGN